MSFGFSHSPEHFSWNLTNARKSGNKKIIAISFVLILGIGAFFTAPTWVPIIQSFLGGVNPAQYVTQPFSIIDGDAHTAWTPAGASVIIYDPHGLTSMPTGDVLPFTLICSCAETPDGVFTATQTLPVGMPIYVYCTDSALAVYNEGVFCKVQAPMSGTTGKANVIGISMWPTDYSAGTYECNENHKYGLAVSMILLTGGAAKTNATNVPTGANSYDLMITALSGYSFGEDPYVDPLTGFYYGAPFVVLQLLTTTARGTCDSANLLASFGGIGSGLYWYWVLGFTRVNNDASITTDGTYNLWFNMNDQTAATDCFAVQIYIGARPSFITSASFGTNQENDNLRLIHYA